MWALRFHGFFQAAHVYKTGNDPFALVTTHLSKKPPVRPFSYQFTFLTIYLSTKPLYGVFDYQLFLDALGCLIGSSKQA